MLKNRTNEYVYPTGLIFYFLNAIKPLIYRIKNTEFTEFIRQLNKTVIRRYMENRIDDLADIDKIGLKQFFEIIDTFLQCESINTSELKENLSHNLCLFYLQQNDDPIIRVKGLNLIKDKLQINLLAKTINPNPEYIKNAIKGAQKFNLLEVVFVQKPCVELIKNIKDFLRILILGNEFSTEIINLIWTCYLSIF